MVRLAENINDISGKVSLDTTDYKANVSELNRQIRVIESGFQAAAAGMDDWSKSAEGLNARIESLTKITELQREKVAALRQQYEQVAAAKGADSKAAQDLEVRINKEAAALGTNEKALRQSQQALDDFGKETVDAATKTDGFALKLNEVGPALAKIGGEIGKAAAASIAAVGAAVAAAGAAAFKMATDAGAAADELLTLSAKTGISTQALQEYTYAARFVDVETETMTAGIAKLTKQMGANNDAFAKLGISTKDGSGSLRDAREVFLETIDALGEMANETERDALAMEIFGKSAQELNPLIKAGSEEIARLAEEAHELGVVLSDDAVAAAGKFDDVMQKFQATTQALVTNIGVAVMPAVEEVVGAIGTIVPKIIEAVKTGNWDEAGEALSEGIGGLVDKAVETLPGLAEAAGKIITTLVEAIAKAIPGMLPELIKVTVDIVNSLVDTLIDNAPLLVKAIVDGVKAIIVGVMDMLPKILELGITLVLELAKGIAEALPELIPAWYEMIFKLTETLWENLPEFVDAGIEIVLALVKGFINAIPVLVEGIMTAIPDMIKAGFEILIALVKAIPDAIVVIVAALPQIITGIVTGIMEALPQIVQAGVDLFVALVKALPEIIKKIVMIIPDIITAIVETVANNLPLIIKAGVDLFVALVKALPTIIIEVVKAVPEIVKAIVLGFKDGIVQMVQVGKDLIGGVWKGIKDSFSDLWNNVKGFFTDLIDKIKQFLHISSPSQMMAEQIGKPMGLGVTEGINAGLEIGTPTVISNLGQLTSTVRSLVMQAERETLNLIQTSFKAASVANEIKDIAKEVQSSTKVIQQGAQQKQVGPNGYVPGKPWQTINLGSNPDDPVQYTTVYNNTVFNSPKPLDMREIKQLLELNEQKLSVLEGV